MARYRQCRETLELLTIEEWEQKHLGDKVQTHYVLPDTPGYQSPIDGAWVEGRKARQADLRRSNSRPWEGMEQEQKVANQRKAESARAEEAKAFKAAERAFMSLPESTRRQLAGGNLDY